MSAFSSLLTFLNLQSTMDKYVKIKKIGEGSFGVAHLARCKDGNDRGKQVVLKEINMNRVSWYFACIILYIVYKGRLWAKYANVSV